MDKRHALVMIVLVTIPKSKAKHLARILLKKKLCACVNILSKLESLFWWQGKIDVSQESLLVIKTKNYLFTKLKKVIETNHPYSVPEIIGFNIDKINNDYLEWLNKETSG